MSQYMGLLDREKKFEEFENKAKTVTGVSKEYTSNKRTIKRKKFADDTSPSIDATVQMSARDKFKIFTFFSAVDNLCTCLKKRKEKYAEVMDIFECIFTLSETHADRLVAEYPDDLNASISNELTPLRAFFSRKPHCTSRSFKSNTNTWTKVNLSKCVHSFAHFFDNSRDKL